jgi:hypothetical protein
MMAGVATGPLLGSRNEDRQRQRRRGIAPVAAVGGRSLDSLQGADEEFVRVGG